MDTKWEPFTASPLRIGRQAKCSAVDEQQENTASFPHKATWGLTMEDGGSHNARENCKIFHHPLPQQPCNPLEL